MTKEADLRRWNPWWNEPAKISEDKKIKEWEDSEIKYEPRLRQTIAYDFEPDNTVVYTLRGPRQVGKTTMVKLQIKDFLEKGVHPWNIFYYSLDLASTKQDVVDLIQLYLKLSNRQRKGRRTYLFLDEISSVADWQKGIKWLVDGDELYNCTVLATGSQAINIKNATERLPGRKGIINDAYDKILSPMQFAEYASLLDSEVRDAMKQNNLSSFENREDIFKKLLAGEIDERLDKINSYQNKINGLFEEYMLTGGIPKIVNEKIEANAILEVTYTNYLDSILGQWSELSKNETILKQFSGAIIKSLGSHISWNGLAREAALGSANTAIEYAHTMQDLFVLSIIHRYGDQKRIPLIQSDRKFYFGDPFFLHIFNGWMSPGANFDASLKYLEDAINQSGVVEGIVADHLIRWAFSTSKKKQAYDYNSHIFYWKDDKGREVDFVLYDGGDVEVPIEVKYRNDFNPKELAPVTNFLDKTGGSTGLVVSKTSLDAKTDYVIVPASVLLLMF